MSETANTKEFVIPSGKIDIFKAAGFDEEKIDPAIPQPVFDALMTNGRNSFGGYQFIWYYGDNNSVSGRLALLGEAFVKILEGYRQTISEEAHAMEYGKDKQFVDAIREFFHGTDVRLFTLSDLKKIYDAGKHSAGTD